MRHFMIALAMVGLLSACGQGESPTSPPVIETLAAVSVEDARLRPPFPGRDIGSAYFTLTNQGGPDRLLAADTPFGARVEIHTHLNENGMMKMRKVDGLDFGAGETVEFKPGSYHLMIFGMSIPEAAKTAPVELLFARAGRITVTASIEGR